MNVKSIIVSLIFLLWKNKYNCLYKMIVIYLLFFLVIILGIIYSYIYNINIKNRN